MKSKIGGLINNEKDLKTELKVLKSFGFDYAELGFNAPEKFIKEFKNKYNVLSKILPILSAHLPAIDFEEEEIEEIKKFILNHLKANCKIFIIHFYTKSSLVGKKNFIKRIKGLAELTDFTLKHKAVLILENTWHIPRFREIFAEIKRLYFCLDIGHANLFSEKNRSLDLINKFGKRLRHIHAHDNFGGFGTNPDSHLPIGQGSIDFSAIFQKLKQINYSGNITLEIYSHRKTSINRIRKLLAG